MALLDLSILGSASQINPDAEGDRYAAAVSNAATSGIGFWKTQKAKKLMDEYRKWSELTPADKFDMDSETQARMGDFDVAKDAEERFNRRKEEYFSKAPKVEDVKLTEAAPDELNQPVSTLDPELQLDIDEQERADMAEEDARRIARAEKARADYEAGWNEEEARAAAGAEAQAEYQRRLAQASRGAQEAYDALFDSPEARAEYEEVRKSISPFTGEGADRRAKFDDERLYELADRVRWYRPDLAAAIEQRAAQSAQRRMALEARRAQMFSPQAVMQRAQIALDAAVRRRDRIAAQLAGDENNENLQNQLRQAEAQVQAIQASYDQAFQGYFGAEIGAGAANGEGPDVVEAVTRQNRLVSELLPRIGEFASLADYLDEARKLGASNKSLGALRQAWKQRFDEEQRAKSADQRDRSLDQGDVRNANAKRALDLRELEIAKKDAGVSAGGIYSQANISKAEGVVRALQNGQDLKTQVNALKSLGYDVQLDTASGGFILFRYGKKVAEVGAQDALRWLQNDYLPKAYEAQSKFAKKSAGKPAAPAAPAAGEVTPEDYLGI